MSGKKSTKRSHAVAKRCARLRAEGLTLSAIADLTGIDRERIPSRIQLGERLLSLETQSCSD